ncbi:sulfite exporter TauE/SafE family protein [Membranihabitans marinus]|uniref:sulfite exporter TauE/SafE family protein n=1 Tax=Membranihabitans marinus TaxID=1227546 RepID=UPI001F2847A8|nr:sulfite exporter TauE/SafE family protein [Membranihabitans marinus]
MTLLDIFVGGIAGLIAGGINTLAGNGSALTLAVLMEFFGLPSNIANATNRIGVLAQTTASTYGFYRSKKLSIQGNQRLLICTILGSFLGIYLAVIISAEGFKTVYKYLLVLMLFILFIKPKRWINPSEDSEAKKLPLWLSTIFYILLGVYGGFIQMGMGIFALAIFVLIGKMNIIKANILKSFIIAVYTLIAVAIFAYKDLIHWPFGLALAFGQMIGGYYTAQFASRSPKASQIAYILLIICVIAAIVKVFNFI